MLFFTFHTLLRNIYHGYSKFTLAHMSEFKASRINKAKYCDVLVLYKLTLGRCWIQRWIIKRRWSWWWHCWKYVGFDNSSYGNIFVLFEKDFEKSSKLASCYHAICSWFTLPSFFQGLAISGAMKYAVEQINNCSSLLPGVQLDFLFNDTKVDRTPLSHPSNQI